MNFRWNFTGGTKIESGVYEVYKSIRRPRKIPALQYLSPPEIFRTYDFITLKIRSASANDARKNRFIGARV